MAIRLRIIRGKLMALCAAKFKAKKGDKYLNDEIHDALGDKFYDDFKSMGFIKKRYMNPHK